MDLDIAVLIVAYRRAENLQLILDLCLKARVKRIYISLDGSSGEHDAEDVKRTQQIANLFNLSTGQDVKIKINSTNVGAARSVISGCNWAFNNEDFLIILEDDCIPNLDFFDFCRESKIFLENDSKIYIASGSQFAPIDFTDSEWLLSRYPLIWGWMTSRDKWVKLWANILMNPSLKLSQRRRFVIDDVYWRAGARRALEGYIDAWDIPIAWSIHNLNGFVIQPAQNLITNLGHDSVATHTRDESQFLGRLTGKFVISGKEPHHYPVIDKWYRQHFYRIRYRHTLSTQITKVMDRLNINKKVRHSLLEYLIAIKSKT